MKQCIFTSCLLIVMLYSSFGQGLPNNTNKRFNSVWTKIVDQKKDQNKKDLYFFYTKYFIDSNIYPNPDAIDLVDAYNKESSFEDIKSNKREFKELLFDEALPEVKEKLKTDSMLAAKPGQALHASFKSAIQTYNQKYKPITTNENLPLSFKDSLSIFSRQVLPAININFNKIPATQMEFFTISLNDINQLLDQLKLPDNAAQMQAINELIKDFFEFKKNTLKYGFYREGTNGFYKTTGTSETGFYFAAYSTLPENEPNAVNENMELANANVYVYTRGDNGKWDQVPKPNSYNVYYGANGLKYSLTPGCDTLSFFKFHPSVPASTLPVVLAKGNYCFVLQDVNTHRLFLRPDINLRDNQVIDNARLIKLCFKVENQ